MPSKKKYNARFPPARIKKIMQTDEEVGKVAAPVPVIISRVLEMFVKNLLGKASEFAANNQARTLLSLHLTQAISSDSRLHFLQETIRQHSKAGDGLDLKRSNAAAEDGDAAASSAIAMMQVAPPPYRPQPSSALVVSSPTTALGSGSFSPCITSSALESSLLIAAPAEDTTHLPARGRGRGRPRGRPPKRPLPDLTPINSNFTPTVPVTKRGRGRPRKQAASPTFVGTDGVTVSCPGGNGPFQPSRAQAQPIFTFPDPKQHPRSPSINFPGGLTVASSYGMSSTAESTPNFSFTVGQAKFGGGSASITYNNSDASPSSQVEGRALGSPVAGNYFQQTGISSPLSASMTISRVSGSGGSSRESSPQLNRNGSLAEPGASGGTILTAPSSQVNPFFSGIKIEIPSLPAAHLPFSIFSPYSLSTSPVTSSPTNKCPSVVPSSKKKQNKHAPPFGDRCGTSTNSIVTPHRDDSTNGNVASGATFSFGEGITSASASSDASNFTGVAVDLSNTATSLSMRHLQSASTSNLDEDYDS